MDNDNLPVFPIMRHLLFLLLLLLLLLLVDS